MNQQTFMFTSDTSSFLTWNQRRFYETNGYLLVKNLVPLEKLNRYEERFREVCIGEVETQEMDIMYDVAIERSEYIPGKKAVSKIQGFQSDEILFEYCTLPQIVNYVESIIGQNIMAMHTMFINKPPDSGMKTSRHPMHQDLHYFPFRPANKIVCSWTPLVKVNRMNGCLVVVPGSHVRPLQPHGYPNWNKGFNKLYHGILNYTGDENHIYLDMNSGDTVFFHPLLYHGSGMNRTNIFRKSISCHYANSECKYVEIQGTTQENIGKEVAEIAKQKVNKLFGSVEGFENITLQDTWRIRGKLVRGLSSNL